MIQKLSSKELDLLRLLYKFRFITVDLATTLLDVKSKNGIRERLNRLLEIELVGRRFDGMYRKNNRQAEYFLQSKGIRALKAQQNVDSRILHNMYKDKNASDSFIRQRLLVARIYASFQSSKVRFLTQSQLQKIEGMPNPKPDGFISFKIDNTSRYYFLDVFSEVDPFFVTLHRRSKRYIELAESGDWQIVHKGTTLPEVLLVCDTSSLEKRLSKRLQKLLKSSWSNELHYYITTIDRLENSDLKEKWLSIDDDMDKRQRLF